MRPSMALHATRRSGRHFCDSYFIGYGPMHNMWLQSEGKFSNGDDFDEPARECERELLRPHRALQREDAPPNPHQSLDSTQGSNGGPYTSRQKVNHHQVAFAVRRRLVARALKGCRAGKRPLAVPANGERLIG